MKSDWEALRYTGQYPPAEVMRHVPNWQFALDEEDVEGQDESTVRPEAQQARITRDTSLTAVDVTLANGAVLPGILELDDGDFRCLWVADPMGEWCVQFDASTSTWEPVSEPWLPAAERIRTVLLTEPSVFPLTFVTRLPVGYTDQLWRVTIDSQGAGQANM